MSQDRRELLELPDLQVHKEVQERRDQLERLGLRDLRVPRVLQAQQDRQDQPALMAQRAQQE